jgi:hypothetical protein
MAKYIQLVEACSWNGDNLEEVLNTFKMLEGISFKPSKKGLLKMFGPDGKLIYKIPPTCYITLSGGLVNVYHKTEFERLFKVIQPPILMAKGADA